MGRPRTQTLWSSPDDQVYVRAKGTGFLVVDTRGTRRETFRTDLSEAIQHAQTISGTAVTAAREMTFFELAIDYFENALPIWDTAPDTVAQQPRTVEYNKSLIRTKFAKFGNTPLSQLPFDLIAQVIADVQSSDHRSKSLQDKVKGLGHRVLAYGQATGVIDGTRVFINPLREVKDGNVRAAGFSGRVRPKLPSHGEVRQFARTAGRVTQAPYMRLFWWLAFYVGFREGELCALRVVDVVHSRRVNVHVVRKVGRGDGGPVIEHFAKGYANRTVTIPRVLEGPLLARVAEVKAAGGTLLFPACDSRYTEKLISYGSLRAHFLKVAAEVGWKPKGWRKAATYTVSSGATKRYKATPSSVEYTIHDARAFAATAMYDPRSGFSLRGMGMSIEAIAKQLGDLPETVRRHYLGFIGDSDAMLDHAVP
jgi:integrase